LIEKMPPGLKKSLLCLGLAATKAKHGSAEDVLPAVSACTPEVHSLPVQFRPQLFLAAAVIVAHSDSEFGLSNLYSAVQAFNVLDSGGETSKKHRTAPKRS
jgi:hypothetical protein